LYTGTAGYYERFRLPYPATLIDDLATRSGADGTGRLLDLACGTGQLCFSLHERFAETWAVDEEREMIEVAKAKALAGGLVDIRFVTSAAEELAAPDSSFDLVAIGNAFHRLRRDTVAVSVLRWLRPGAFLALVWSDSPWVGDAPWQRALAATIRRWTERAGLRGCVPAGYDADRLARSDQTILQASEFQLIGRYEFAVPRVWTLEELAGFMASTSVLSRPALGDFALDFDADLERELTACASVGTFHQVVRFAYDLARRPA
jgi:ubiquinone/menaquinone biosynthesis C-methylase UbiE